MVGDYAKKGNNGKIFFSDVGTTMAEFLRLKGKLEGKNIFKI
jgi:phosphopentomutase